jgi:hypothetical protein
LLANFVLFSGRHTDTGVLSLTPLKCLALSTGVVPSEPHPEPPYVEPLPVQVEEELAMATAVEELAASPPPVAAAVVEEERVVMEMTAPKRHWSHMPGLARAARTW